MIQLLSNQFLGTFAVAALTFSLVAGGAGDNAGIVHAQDTLTVVVHTTVPQSPAAATMHATNGSAHPVDRKGSEAPVVADNTGPPNTAAPESTFDHLLLSTTLKANSSAGENSGPASAEMVPEPVEVEDSGKMDNASALMNRARALAEGGKYAAALAEYALAVNKASTEDNKRLMAEALHGAAQASHQVGKLQDALNYIERAIAVNQSVKNARARSLDHLLEGRILMSVSRFADALKSFEEAEKLLPVSEASVLPALLEEKGRCLLRLNRHADSLKTLNRALSMLDKAGDEIQAARLSLHIGDIHVSRSDYKAAKALFAKSESVYRKHNRNEELGQTLLRMAYLHQILGDLKAAQKTADEGQSLLVHKMGSAITALPLFVKGMNAYREGKVIEAEHDLTEALGRYQKTEDPVMEARVRLALARVHLDRSRCDLALELAGKSLAEFRNVSSVGGETAALLVIATAYFRQGFVTKASEYTREALAISKKAGDRDTIVQSGILLADIQESLGNISSAQQMLQEALELSKSGLNAWTQALLGLAIARYRLSREDLDKALQAATAARKGFQELNDRRGAADCDHLMGVVHELRGDTEKAFELLDKALREHRAMWDRYGEGRVLTALGIHFKNRGDQDRAWEYVTRALEIRKGIGDLRGCAANLANLGNLFRHRHEYSEAQKNLEQALTMYQQLSDKKGQADVLTSMGQVDAARGMLSSALQKLGRALALHREIKDARGISNDLASTGRVYLSKGDLENASASLEEAQKMMKGVRDPKGSIALMADLAMLQRARRNPANASALLNKAHDLAKNIGDETAVSSINLKMATVYEDAGEHEKALKLLHDTVATARRKGDRTRELWALGGMGIVQAKTEDYENALTNLAKAQRLRAELGIPASQSRDLDFYIGEIYDGFRDYERALEHYHKALAFYQIHLNDAVLAQLYDRIGTIYYRMEEYSKARSFFEDALRLSTETRNVSMQKTQLIRLGDILSKLGNSEEALKYQQKALTLTREGGDQHTEARILTRIGTLYQILGRPRTALEHYREAKEIRIKQGDRRGVNENLLQIALVNSILGDFDTAVSDVKKAFEIAHSSEDRNMLWKAYFIMGRTLEGRKSYGEALESYRKAIAVLEAMEADVVEDSDEDDFIFGGKTTLFETTLRVLMRLAKKDPEGAYDNQALRIVEKLKAAEFEATLSKINVENFSDLPHELLIKEKSLNLTLRKLNTHLAEERAKVNPNLDQIRKLLAERRAKEKSFVELKELLKQKYPSYADLRYPRPLSVEQLQREVIDQDEAILEYMVTRSRTYLFAIDKRRFHTFSLDCPGNELEKDVEAVTRPLYRADTLASWDPSVAYRIYSKMVKPVEYFLVGKKAVTIIPHGPLSAVPFEIFVSSESHAGKRFWSAKDQPSYLVEKYAFCYAPSLSALSHIRTRKRGPKPGWNLVAFGDAVYAAEEKAGELNPGAERLIAAIGMTSGGSRGEALQPLPGTRKEITEIARIVGSPAQIYFGPQATETLFKKADLTRYNYIHLATHGVLLSGAGKLQHQPAILFSLYGDSENDGFLQLGEVFGLKLNSDLVFLSSCLTPGTPHFADTQGLMGLSRAFLFAGTDAVILSLWQVNDENTAKLFAETYRNLLQESKSEALRAGKLALLKNIATSHPYYWAPFILQGNWHTRLHPRINTENQETVRFKGPASWGKWLSM